MKKNIKKPIILNEASLKRLMSRIDSDLISKTVIESWLSSEFKLAEEQEKNLNFRSSTLEKLSKIVNIEQDVDENKFKAWFSYKYEIKKEENDFLKKLIKDNIIYLSSYNEQTLTVKFIGQILNKIEFRNKLVKDWYEYKISCRLNDWTLSGEPDFFLASGRDEPKTPYFFLQEYKREVKFTGHPKYQVLSAMLAAIKLNNKNTIKGGYIIGRYWNFVILEKLENGNYKYFVSKGFDCLDFIELKKIYIYLHAVKKLYCK